MSEAENYKYRGPVYELDSKLLTLFCFITFNLFLSGLIRNQDYSR